jgi:hypothetical protein
MRGKFVVVGLVVLTVVMLAVGWWFLNVLSPVDQRFNFRRRAIPENAEISLLLPEKIEDFKRQSLTPLETTTSGSTGSGAVYLDSAGKIMVLTVRRNPDWPTSKALPENGTFKTHFDAQVPYAYGRVEGQATFIWGRGGWMLSASAQEADAETLLQFVNLYPY